MSIGFAADYDEAVMILDALVAHGGAEEYVEYVIDKARTMKSFDEASRRIYVEKDRWLSPS